MNVYQPGTNRAFAHLAKHALTSAFAPSGARAHGSYTVFMRLPERDREILQLVGRFRQMTTHQIKALVYPNQPHNPQRRTITRLLDNKLLARVNERMAGGVQGGNQTHVYQLGATGRRMFDLGRRGHSIVIDHHALAVVDTYVALRDADSRGLLRLLNWSTEPDCHIDLGGVHLEPDMYVDIVTKQPDGQSIRWPRWLEIDMGTEHKRQILEKMEAYKRAYEARADYPLPIYPTVLLLATSDDRASELKYWLRYARGIPDGMVTVGTMANLLHILQR